MLSDAQQQLWFLHRMEPSSAYTVPIASDITGALDVDALRGALQSLVDRHEILRTQYVEDDGVPTARVHPPTALDCPVVRLASGERELRDELRERCARPLTLDGPLRVQATIFRLAAEHHVLFLMFHHIVADGASVDLFLNELCRHYRSELGDEAGSPPQFAEHVRAERAGADEAAAGEQLEYWRGRLAGLEDFELPADRSRPAAGGEQRGELLRRGLPPGLMSAVGDLAVRARVSPFMVVFAAFAWTLSRATGSTDVPIGVPSSGRTNAASFETIGLFVNMLVIRNRIDPDLGFTEFLHRVRGDLLADLGHAGVPFSKVVEAVRPTRRAGANPLFKVAFGYERGRPELTLAPGVVLRHRDGREVDTGTAKFDLDIQVSAAGDDSLLYAEYSRDLFDRWRIEQLIDRFVHVLAASVAEPGLPLREIELIGRADRDRLIEQLTGPSRPSPAARLHELFERQARATPTLTAAQCPDGTLSYAELDAGARAVAERLRLAGVEPGDRVAVLTRRGVALPAAVLGVLKAGAAYLPVDPEAPARRVRSQLADSAVRFLVDGADVRPVEPGGAAAARRPPDPRALAYVLYTSGSTGRPKGVLVSHAAAVDFVTQFSDRFGIGEGARVLQFSSLTFDASVLELFAALCRGGTVCMPPAEVVRAPDELSDYLRDERVEVAVLPPTVVDLMPVRPGRPLRLLSLGGEVVPAQVAARWCAPGRAVLNSYGPTEATVIATSHLCEPGQTDPLPIGPPRANSHVYVVDAFGGLAPAGVPGELWLGGAGVAEGYENAPEATRAAFRPDPFVPGRGTVYRTGDRCALGPDGELRFLGRLDGQVKIRGLRVELGEVEAALASQPGVRQAAVRVVGSGADARLAGWVVPAADGVETAGLRTRLSALLPAYMLPSTIETIDAIPLNRHGKVDRSALPQAQAPVGATPAPPRTPEERHVAEAVAVTLGAARVGVLDDFFELGGTSLQIMRLLAELRRRLGVSLPVGDVYAAPTVAALARRAAGASRQPLPAQLSALTGGDRAGREAVPVFLIHPSSGSALCYAPLAQRAGPRLECWGVGAEALHGGPLPESVGAMADQYAELIARTCPDRPVYVAGWSFGGILAHAVVGSLRRRRNPAVGGLVLIDAVLPDGPPPAADRVAENFRVEVARTLGGAAAAAPGPELAPQLDRRLELYAAIVRAVYRHQPDPVDVPALAVAAARTDAPAEAWDKLLLGPVRREVLGTDHFGLVTGPAAVDLAAALTRFVTRTR